MYAATKEPGTCGGLGLASGSIPGIAPMDSSFGREQLERNQCVAGSNPVPKPSKGMFMQFYRWNQKNQAWQQDRQVDLKILMLNRFFELRVHSVKRTAKQLHEQSSIKLVVASDTEKEGIATLHAPNVSTTNDKSSRSS